MTKMSRADVVQGILSLYDNPAYLEVGVSKGVTFHSIEATRKVAVDPRFRFKARQLESEGSNATYHEVTSDTYFGEIANPAADRFDVIYLDGLHTLEQTLRDFTNSLTFLSASGVIVVDDVYPVSYVASMPDIEEHRVVKRELNVHRGAWMGDVYRLVFFIDTFFQQLTYRTVAENHGQLVAWGARRPTVPNRRVEDIARLPYERVVLERDAFRLLPFAEILAEVRLSVASADPHVESG